MAEKRISDLPVRAAFDPTCSFPVEPVPAEDPDVTERITAEQVSTFTNLRPFTGLFRNAGLAASVDAGALTIALKQADGETDPSDALVHSLVEAFFRSSVLGSGARDRVVFSEGVSVTIPSGSTLGFGNGDDAKIYVYLFSSGSTVGLAVSSALQNPELLATVALVSGGANADGLYSASYAGQAAIVCLGYVQVSAIETAGVWTQPDLVFVGDVRPGISGEPGGASAFLDLTDAPETYAGQGGKIVRVNDAENGLEFANESSGPASAVALPLGENTPTDECLVYDVETGELRGSGLPADAIVQSFEGNGDVADGEIVVFEATSGVVIKGSRIAIAEIIRTHEIRVSSGGSTAVNAAILALHALGGGIVRLDGLIDLDADITMRPGVTLRGYGPGTGLRNNSGDALKVSFEGDPTTYSIAAPVAGSDQFTCDTLSDAAGFSAGDAVLLEDDDATYDECQMVFVKTGGAVGTGVVEIFDQIRKPITDANWSATTTASKLTFSHAGLADLDLQNTGAGSLTVEITYAWSLRFSRVTFEESTVALAHCGDIDFDRCKFLSRDNRTLARHVAFEGWVSGVNFSECELRGAVAAFEWTGEKALRRISIYDCDITGCGTAFDFTPVNPGSTSCGGVKINDNFLDLLESPESGGGTGHGFVTNNVFFADFEMVGNEMSQSDTAAYAVNVACVYPIQFTRATIAGNKFGGSLVGKFTIGSYNNLTVSSNVIGGAVLFTGGGYIFSFVGNLCLSTVTFDAEVSRWNEEVQITGNFFNNYFSMLSTAGSHNFHITFTGNRVSDYTYFGKNSYAGTISGNYFHGTLEFGVTAGDRNDLWVVTGNYLVAGLVWNAQAQNDCVVVGNYVGGSQVLPNGLRCIVESSQLLKTSGARIKGVTTVNAAAYDVLDTDHVLLVSYSETGTCAIDLKTAQLVAGRTLRIKDIGGLAETNPITISTEGTATIDGEDTAIIDADYGTLDLICDGTNWFRAERTPEGWKSFSPSGSWATNATYTGNYRLIDGVLECCVKIALSGAPDAAALTVNLPSGFSVNRSAILNTVYFVIGSLLASDADGLVYDGLVAIQENVNGSVKAFVTKTSATYETINAIAQNLPITFANGDYVTMIFSVPVVRD